MLNNGLNFEHDEYPFLHMKTDSGQDFPLHFHKHVEYIYLLEGAFTVQIDEKTLSLKPGDSGIVFPYVLHRYKVTGKNVRFLSVFEPEILGDLTDTFYRYAPTDAFVPGDSRVAELFSDVAGIVKWPNPCIIDGRESGSGLPDFRNLRIKAAFLSLLAETLGRLRLVPRSPHEKGTFNQMLRYCCQHYSSDGFSLDAMAEETHISRSHISHTFAEKTGGGVLDYINTLRVSAAVNELIYSQDSVADIAFRSGFGSIRSFNRVFRGKKGEAPTEFRSKKRKTY